MLRQLWGELWAGAAKRRRSSEHERIFFQLLGYTLRPGFGYALDEWRCEQSFKLFEEKVEFHREKPNWNEFWVMWRRICGGLKPERQIEWWTYAQPHLSVRLPTKAPKNISRPKGLQPEGIEEMLRASAAMEHLPAGEKKLLGDIVWERVKSLAPAGGPWAWSLARLGARVPLYGSVHNVLVPAGIYPWIDLMLENAKLEGSSLALAHLSRPTGDRARDIDEQKRAAVLQALAARPGSESWIEMARNVGELKPADAARIFGESLPLGLHLTRGFRAENETESA